MVRSKKLLARGLIIAVLTFFIIYVFLRTLQTRTPYRDTDEFVTVRALDDPEPLNENILINFTGFRYKTRSTACAEGGKEVLGVILITSYVGHDELRSAHRQAVSKEKLAELGFVRVFLLAEPPSHERFITQAQISNEQKKFNDIVQGNFLEAYRNLTYKHIMGLKFAATYCNISKFVIKADDDIVFDIFQLKNFLESIEIKGEHEDFIAGYVQNNMEAIRLKASKWYVSLEEFDESTYPDFVSGWFYITNIAVARKLAHESEHSNFFWIDDTFVTGILRQKLGITLNSLNKWFSANSQFLECCIRDFQEYSYGCDFFVGPNGGDNNLIIKFLHGVEKCYFDECVKRPPEKSLRRTCVAEARRFLKDHGDAFVNPIKLR